MIAKRGARRLSWLLLAVISAASADPGRSALAAAEVAGEYTRGDEAYDSEVEPATITITALPDGRVEIGGEALWVGDAERGQVHVGTLEGRFPIEGGVVRYSDGAEGGCRITLRFRPDALEAEETGGPCGGMNVRFGGRYSRNP